MDAREKNQISSYEHVANISKIEITNNDFNRQADRQTDNIFIARLTISNIALKKSLNK